MATPTKKNDQPSSITPTSPDDKGKSAASGDLAEPTFEPGQQTVDPKQDKVLPKSAPGEIAPLPDNTATTKKAGDDEKPATSSTGYRVVDGKSVTAKTGDLLNAGDEIGEKHVDGGAERLEELARAGVIEKVGGGSSSPSSTSSSGSSQGGSSSSQLGSGSPSGSSSSGSGSGSP
jgi:hypothetical protein